MARRHVELCRRFPDDGNRMAVSTVQLDGASEFDSREEYPINRQPFHFREANRFTNQVRWASWLAANGRRLADVLHCGNIRPVGYSVLWAASRLSVPYLVYVNGGDLLREKQKSSRLIKRATAKRILGGAAGIVATSRWVAELTRDVMTRVGVERPPPVGAFDLGTDPDVFAPVRNGTRLRTRWRAGNDPILLTVARLVPHKGQDTGIRVLAALASEFPRLRYALVGDGHDERRLRILAKSLRVEDRVIFAGALSDQELPEAYATSTLYLGASRIDNEINAEGFGISFLEASASGLPVVAGDSGGVRSAVRDGETGIVEDPRDVQALAAHAARFLRDGELRQRFGSAGRNAVVDHYNWDRVARDTREFTLEVVARWRAAA
jgi:phosphatidylinositol alpha-1,6-mannosyltransferase